VIVHLSKIRRAVSGTASLAAILGNTSNNRDKQKSTSTIKKMWELKKMEQRRRYNTGSWQLLKASRYVLLTPQPTLKPSG
jgi:GDP-D-mannose dehydratase